MAAKQSKVTNLNKNVLGSEDERILIALQAGKIEVPLNIRSTGSKQQKADAEKTAKKQNHARFHSEEKTAGLRAVKTATSAMLKLSKLLNATTEIDGKEKRISGLTITKLAVFNRVALGTVGLGKNENVKEKVQVTTETIPAEKLSQSHYKALCHQLEEVIGNLKLVEKYRGQLRAGRAIQSTSVTPRGSALYNYIAGSETLRSFRNETATGYQFDGRGLANALRTVLIDEEGAAYTENTPTGVRTNKTIVIADKSKFLKGLLDSPAISVYPPGASWQSKSTRLVGNTNPAETITKAVEFDAQHVKGPKKMAQLAARKGLDPNAVGDFYATNPSLFAMEFQTMVANSSRLAPLGQPVGNATDQVSSQRALHEYYHALQAGAWNSNYLPILKIRTILRFASLPKA